jgi:hypothetical protein
MYPVPVPGDVLFHLADLLEEIITVSLPDGICIGRFDPGPALGLVLVLLGDLDAGLVNGLLLFPLLFFLDCLCLGAGLACRGSGSISCVASRSIGVPVSIVST